jgi:hypothetical protein
MLGARFGVLDRAEVAPASSSPAAREGRPRRWLFRRGAGAVGAKGGRGIFGRRSWSLGGAQAVADAGGTMDATVAAFRARRHGHNQCRRLGAARGVCASREEQRPLLATRGQ